MPSNPQIDQFDNNQELPESERVYDGPELHVGSKIGHSVKTKLCTLYNFIFNNENLIDLNERLEGIYKKEPSEDILVQKNELKRLRLKIAK